LHSTTVTLWQHCHQKDRVQAKRGVVHVRG